MSGIKTVSEVQKLLRQPVHSQEEIRELKALNLLNQDETLNDETVKKLKGAVVQYPNAIVSVNKEGEMSFIAQLAETKDTTVTQVTPPQPVTERFSVAKVKEIIEGKTFSIDPAKVKEVLEEYVKGLPKTTETYGSGSIIVYYFKGVDLSVSSLLSAGTKVLDAIMYMSFGSSEEHKFIFKSEELNPKMIKVNEITDYLTNGNRAIKAAFCCVYNQGSLPSKSNDERNLSKFIKETVFRDKSLTANKFCDFLSSADPSFFPAKVFLEIPFDHLPTEVASRCKMAVAGNKAIRYAIFSRRFEQNKLADLTTATAEEMKNHMIATGKIEKAIKIAEKLSALGSDFEAQKKMHPLSISRTSRKNFTLQLTAAILFSLSEEGRVAMRSAIDSNKIEAFKRDENIYGVKNALGFVTFPVLTNSVGA